VDDVVDATLAAGGVGAAGEMLNPRPGVYNVGSGVATSFNQILDALRKVEALAGLEAEYFEMPPSIRAFYQDYTCADLTETRQGLNWAPKWKPAEAITQYGSMLAGNSRL
jgi:ADP-L-glycero-D-manno-heptose 6-epimerase